MKNKRRQSSTCLAVLKTKQNKLIMAGDRRSSWGHQAQAMPRPKISQREGLLLGGTGDGYLCTLIVDIFPVPTIDYQNIDNYMHNEFHCALSAFLKSKGFSDGKESLRIVNESEVEILVGIDGKLYQILITSPEDEVGGIIAIDELSLPYATGCGGLLAWGSLLTTKLLKGMKEKERLLLALTVAADVSIGCDKNIDIISE